MVTYSNTQCNKHGGGDYKSEVLVRYCAGLRVRALLDEPHLHTPEGYLIIL